LPSPHRDPIEFPANGISDGAVRLRLMDESDIPVVVALADDPTIARFTSVPSPYTEREARAWLKHTRAGLQAGTDLHPLLVDAETDEVLGTCGVARRSRDEGTWEVGYWIGAANRGRGLAARGVRLISGFTFEVIGARRIELLAEEANPASVRTAENCGFTREGLLRSYLQIGGARRDVAIYSLLPNESPSVGS
jgi:[ribosomal protein S5]-alanine N-acetyltransferase